MVKKINRCNFILWQDWDQTVIEWPYIVQIGKDFLKGYQESDKLFV